MSPKNRIINLITLLMLHKLIKRRRIQRVISGIKTNPELWIQS
jgi:hypothetical protein